MTWEQLYALCITEERDETAILIIQTIEHAKNKSAVSKGRLFLESFGNFRGAHLINNKRRQVKHSILLYLFMFTISTVSVASWLVTIYAPPPLAASILTINLAFLFAILLFKPYRKPAQSTPFLITNS